MITYYISELSRGTLKPQKVCSTITAENITEARKKAKSIMGRKLYNMIREEDYNPATFPGR